MTTDVSFDGVALADAVPDALITNVTRSLLGSARDVYDELPGRAGSTLFAEKPGDRKIVVDLDLLADDVDARRAAVRALAEWVDRDDRAQLIVDDESDRYWEAKLSTVPDPAEWAETGQASLEFRAGPYAFATAPSSSTWSSSDATPHTLTIPDTVEALPVVELTAAGAFVAGFTLNVGGLVLERTDALVLADVITISGISYTVSTGPNTDTELDGTFDPETISMANVDGDFPLLAPGDNTITIEGGAATVVVTWRRRYR